MALMGTGVAKGENRALEAAQRGDLVAAARGDLDPGRARACSSTSPAAATSRCTRWPRRRASISDAVDPDANIISGMVIDERPRGGDEGHGDRHRLHATSLSTARRCRERSVRRRSRTAARSAVRGVWQFGLGNGSRAGAGGDLRACPASAPSRRARRRPSPKCRSIARPGPVAQRRFGRLGSQLVERRRFRYSDRSAQADGLDAGAEWIEWRTRREAEAKQQPSTVAAGDGRRT